ncbi:sulfatase [Maribellus maritimus]|uniref:sulfatase n=1 Tax=Maribellus maritimus TaxID=2870838 RepID=UPI001EEB264E|nr:sulfatase [Maribellus maritimus]MCG6189380.1 sulfatase [Maribellus maritimus]
MVLSILLSGSINIKAQEKPNIVFFLVDDLGWSDLGCFGSDYYMTPNIDKLADQGMKFTSAYMMPTCSPSRASLMTGEYAPRTGIFSVDGYANTPSKMKKLKGIPSKKYLVPEDITIAEVLKNAGYKTGSFGKWHLGNNEETYPTNQGFDVNVGGCEAGSPKSYFSPFVGIKNIDVKEKGKYITEVLTDSVCAFIDGNKNKPFFIYFPFYQVHVPVHAKKEWVEKYKGKEGFYEQNNPNYGAMVSYMDYSVGRVLNKLEELNLSKNTIVVLTSDNGGQIMVTSNAPLKGQKGNLYEGGIRVPLIVRWPGKAKQGSSSDVPVTVVDYFPTLAAMAGAAIPENKIIDGESIVPLLDGGKCLNRDAIFWHLTSYNGNGHSNSYLWQAPGGVIRKGNWKLIENFEDHSIELYNLKKDIGETQNLSNKNSKKAKELLTDLKNWQKEMEAPIPTEPNPGFKPGAIDWLDKWNTRIIEQAEKQTLVK